MKIFIIENKSCTSKYCKLYYDKSVSRAINILLYKSIMLKDFSFCFNFDRVTCSFITRTEGLLNEICLVDVVGCTLNICFLGFNMMTVRNIGK